MTSDSGHDEVVESKISGLEKTLDAKFAAYDKAIALLQANADRQPSIAVVAASVASLEKLHDEKFRGVDNQFVQRDVALVAALSAAKEAVGEAGKNQALVIDKLDKGFTKQIELLTATLTMGLQNVLGVANDLKERIVAVEVANATRKDAVVSGREGIGMTVSVIVAAFGG